MTHEVIRREEARLLRILEEYPVNGRKTNTGTIKMIRKEIGNMTFRIARKCNVSVNYPKWSIQGKKVVLGEPSILLPTLRYVSFEELKAIELSEYVGDRFEAFLTERRYDHDGKVARYDSERKLTAANLLTGQYLEKELGAKVERLIANAKKEVEESLISSLEQKLKENLAKDTIEKMNIPEVLKRFTEMSLEQKQ